MTLVEFLGYAGTSAGVNVIIGVVLSFLAEWWPGYGELSPRVKRLMMMGLSFVVPVLALVGLWFFDGRVVTAEAVWLALLAGFSAFFGSQAAHVRNLDDGTRKARWVGLEAMSNEVVAVCAELINQEKERRRAAGLSDDIEFLFGEEAKE